MADGLEQLQERIARGNATVGVVGLGYVGLPLAVEVARSGFKVIGCDISEPVCAGINAGKSHVEDVPAETLAGYVKQGLITATTDFARLKDCDVISICVPTPLNKTKDPDLSYVVAAAESCKAGLRAGQVIILESTTYPGTTREVLPIFESTGLKVGVDFGLCFSPERVDPGNAVWQTRNTPKVIGGITKRCNDAAMALYGKVFDTLVPVESPEAAELVKVYENTFRMINIALANELAHWVFVGDSGNDQPMFQHFQHSVGVANIRHCAAGLTHLPRYITTAENRDRDQPLFKVIEEMMLRLLGELSLEFGKSKFAKRINGPTIVDREEYPTEVEDQVANGHEVV